MSDEKDILISENVVIELSKNIYSDIGHPILKEVGSIGESVMKFVALPFKFLGLTAEQLEVKYKDFLEKTINKVETNDRVMPHAVIAAPLLEHVKFVFEEDGLAEMFSNLLANAMCRNIQSMVHPAFSEMLKQMSPLDAEFMNIYFEKNDIVEVTEINWKRGEKQKILTIDSLSRLGILSALSYDDRDDIALLLTDFGKTFRDLCLLEPSEIHSDICLDEYEILENDKYVNFDEIGLLFEDSFGTARISKESGEMYIRSCFQMDDVRKGSKIVLLFRINNIGTEAKIFERVYIECGKKIFVPQNIFPICIEANSYYDCVFVAIEGGFWKEILNEKTKYVVQLGDTIYDVPITGRTKKEVEIYVQNNEEGDRRDV